MGVCTRVFVYVVYMTYDSTFMPFSTAITEQAYHSDNPYHNCTHAADVLQALHCLLTDTPVSFSQAPC